MARAKGLHERVVVVTPARCIASQTARSLSAKGLAMSALLILATLLLCLTILLCAGTILQYLVLTPYGASRVEEIRRLRQEGLAVNQAGEG